jgi:hypothetical protein
MSYIVNRTDGNIAAVVNDGTIDTTTSLNLVGKGTPNYAETVAEDLIALLENFSSILTPRRPLPGQLWYNKASRQIHVYDEKKQQFTVVNNTTFNTTPPANPLSGDFWYHTEKKQLSFYRDNFWQVVAPAYADSQGRSELVVETIKNNYNVDHTVVTLFAGGNRTVIISSNPEFQPYPNLAGFETIYPGVNLPSIYSQIIRAKLNGTSLFADTAHGLDAAADATYMHANTDTSTVGTLTVANNDGLYIGVDGDVHIETTPSNTFISTTSNKKFNIQGYNGLSQITLSNTNGSVGINKNNPSSTLDVDGTISATDSIKTGDAFLFNDNSSIFTLSGDIYLAAAGGTVVALQAGADGGVTVSGPTVLNSGLTVNNGNIVATGNVNVATLPTQTSHLTNKRYVDAIATYNVLPLNSIIMWYGSPADVPVGWQICNGTNGTPDLRDRFVMGAGTSAMGGQADGQANGAGNYGTFDTSTIGDHAHVGTSGAGGVHNHNGLTGNYTLTVADLPAHAHNVDTLFGQQDDAGLGALDRNGNRFQPYNQWGDDHDADTGNPVFFQTTTFNAGGGSSHNHTIANSDTHTHTLTVEAGGTHKHTVSIDKRPSWIALYYIMKTSNVLIPPSF